MDEPPLGSLHVGTAGFSSAHWAGSFYPGNVKKGEDQLECYQESFWVVEVNSSFYGTPSADTIASWRRRCAEGFLMGLKVPKTVTHDAGSPAAPAALESLRHFAQRVAGLGKHLGPVLFQCPRSLKADVKILQQVDVTLAALPEEARLKDVAFEFRHASWFQDAESLDFMKTKNWALVQHPNALGRATSADTAHYETYQLDPLQASHTADFVYVRLHGNNDAHQYRYTDEELSGYAQQLHAWRSQGLRVFCFLLNDDSGAAMPQNVQSSDSSFLAKSCRLML
ncbi:yecE [Symbiodinium natans]|uniref:YecE protein n=1 Tax=Symbiodinium natans TaxID=878477 RepID=A0A812V1L1_9DINO|nr:yecE [Symbiodinium natans]